MRRTDRALVVVSVVALMVSHSAQGTLIFEDLQDADQTAYDADASSVDLIDAGSSTLAASSLAACSFGWAPAGLNNGVAADTSTDTSLYAADSGPTLPAQSTFSLDLTTATLGYDLSSIVSIAGWNNPAIPYGNQRFTVEYSQVGNASYSTLFADHTVAPWSGTGATRVTVTDDAGFLATGVDSIRVTYNATTGNRTIIREFDVQGTATVPEPSSALLILAGGVGIGLLRRRRAS